MCPDLGLGSGQRWADSQRLPCLAHKAGAGPQLTASLSYYAWSGTLVEHLIESLQLPFEVDTVAAPPYR